MIFDSAPRIGINTLLKGHPENVLRLAHYLKMRPAATMTHEQVCKLVTWRLNLQRRAQVKRAEPI